MDIVLHAGAHFTEEERLIKCLLRNKENWAQRGIAVPGPGRYRRLLRDTLIALGDAEAAEDARDVLLDAILDQERADRMILSHPHLFGVAHALVRDGLFYPEAAARLVRMTRVFGEDDLELFFAIRNPATFVPAAFARAGVADVSTLLRGTDPRGLSWSYSLEAIRDAVPGVPITVWCNEDAPLVWEQVLRALAGPAAGRDLEGGCDLALDLMTAEGGRRLTAYLAEHPEFDPARRSRARAAFLAKFARTEALEEELDLPGWTEDLVAELTEIYDEDTRRLASLPGLQLIQP